MVLSFFASNTWPVHTRHCFEFIVALSILCACGGRGRGISSDNDAGDSDVFDQADAEADGQDGDVIESEDVPQCGDGVLDPGEECDDRNRLNGDGCDWLCQIGDGEPPPEPDIDAVEFEPTGSAVEFEDVVTYSVSFESVPLVWNGDVLATVLSGNWQEDQLELYFYRFNLEGDILDAEWEVHTISFLGMTDLIWSGAEYYLFYTQLGDGIFMQRLDPTGKPTAPPVELVDNSCAHTIAASIMGSNPAISYSIVDFGPEHDIEGCEGEGSNPQAGLYLSAHEVFSGDSIIGPRRLIDGWSRSSDIAAGSEGYAVTSLCSVADIPTTFTEGCFYYLDRELESIVSSAVLSPTSDPLNVVYDGEIYWVAWTHNEDGSDEICVARFSRDGLLIAAPICTSPSGHREFGAPRIAVIDSGVGLVVGASTGLIFMSLDNHGVPIGEVSQVDRFAGEEGYRDGLYSITAAGEVFAVMYSRFLRENLKIRLYAPVDDE